MCSTYTGRRGLAHAAARRHRRGWLAPARGVCNVCAGAMPAGVVERELTVSRLTHKPPTGDTHNLAVHVRNVPRGRREGGRGAPVPWQSTVRVPLTTNSSCLPDGVGLRRSARAGFHSLSSPSDPRPAKLYYKQKWRQGTPPLPNLMLRLTGPAAIQTSKFGGSVTISSIARHLKYLNG